MPAEQSTFPNVDADPGLLAWLKSPWQAACLTFGVIYWVIGGLVWSLVGWLLYFLLPRRIGKRVGDFMIHWGFRGFVAYLHFTRLVRPDFEGLKHLRNSHEPLILAPNHTSLWDAVFLLTCTPRPVCLMKKEILRNPLLGGIATLAGHIPSTANAAMIRAASDALKDGGQLLLFPEGTRTRRESRWINPLKGGIALIAERAEVPVYPVFIRTNSPYLEKGWPPWRRPEFPIHINMELGEPLRTMPGESAQQFIARLTEVFEHELSRPHPLRRRSRG